MEKLGSFEEDGQEFNERPRLQPRVVSRRRRGREQSSNLNYMDSSQDLVKIRHMSPDVIGSMIGDIIGDMMGKMIGDVICR